MTLLELLCKELPKRGGWPDNAVRSWQSVVDGEIYFDSSSNKRVEHRNGNIYLPIVGNALDEIITCEQYEAAIAAQQPVWDGEGLPPVGCECELYDSESGWEVVFIKYVGNKTVVLDLLDGGEYSFELSTCDFRPIRTEAERRRDDFVKQIIKWMHYAGEAEVALIYDAIAAGKIPGVELSK